MKRYDICSWNVIYWACQSGALYFITATTVDASHKGLQLSLNTRRSCMHRLCTRNIYCDCIILHRHSKKYTFCWCMFTGNRASFSISVALRLWRLITCFFIPRTIKSCLVGVMVEIIRGKSRHVHYCHWLLGFLLWSNRWIEHFRRAWHFFRDIAYLGARYGTVWCRLFFCGKTVFIHNLISMEV